MLERQGPLAQRHWGFLSQPGAPHGAAWAGWDPKTVLGLHPHSGSELGDLSRAISMKKQGNREFSPKSFVDLKVFFHHT